MAQDDDELIVGRWAAAEGIDHREWSDELLVYDGASADTHLLDGNAAAILMTLLEGATPLSAAELHAALHDSGTPDANQSFAGASEMLVAALHELQKIGLAKRVAQ